MLNSYMFTILYSHLSRKQKRILIRKILEKLPPAEELLSEEQTSRLRKKCTTEDTSCISREQTKKAWQIVEKKLANDVSSPAARAAKQVMRDELSACTVTLLKSKLAVKRCKQTAKVNWKRAVAAMEQESRRKDKVVEPPFYGTLHAFPEIITDDGLQFVNVMYSAFEFV